jgi:hypothetical protein
MFALWLVYLVFLVMMHSLQPNDPWNQTLARPVFLISGPLLVACVPLLATKRARRTTTDYEDGSDWNLPRNAKWIDSDAVRRMALVWLVSLAVFASPHGLRAPYLDPIMHQPLFLLVAPLVLACIPLLAPWPIPIRCEAVQTGSSLGRARVWNGITACVMLAVILIGMLVLINVRSLLQSSMSVLWPNVFFGGGLIAAIMRIGYLVKLLRTAP